MSDIQQTIENYFERRTDISPVNAEVLTRLDNRSVRVTKKQNVI
ncbi:MAG: hypothetical protein ACKE9I_08270 [Methylophagaceae bacterium]